VKVNGIGTVDIGTLHLVNVLYAPDFKVNLISVGKVTNDQYEMAYFSGSGGFILTKEGKKTAPIVYNNGLYKLAGTQNPKVFLSKEGTLIVGLDPQKLLIEHQRMGHCSRKVLRKLGLKGKMPECEVCILSRRVTAPFNSREKFASEVLFRMHSDVGGPYNIVGLNGERYHVFFVDEASRKAFMYCMRTRDELLTKLKDFMEKEQTYSGLKVVMFRSDNAGEFRSNEIKAYLTEKGIELEKVVPYTPQQNGIAERVQQTIVTKARIMLLLAGLSKAFWPFALAAATYCYNRTPHKALNYETPNSVYYKNVKRAHDNPSARNKNKLFVFGSKVYVSRPGQEPGKLDTRSERGIYLGIEDGLYKVLLLGHTNQVILVRTMKINEGEFWEKRNLTKIWHQQKSGGS
jgi:transposase InsO family protein